MPSTSSTAHVRQPFTGNFVRSGEPCLANRNSEGEDIPSLACIICLIQRLILCMKPFVILRPKTDLFGPLTESFSLPNNPAFKMRAFFKDRPVNQKSFFWKIFRLSTSRMTAIADHSTHVRATCNFYLRAKLSEINVTDYARIDKYKGFEYIDIRGYGCGNCTAHLIQSSQWHPHVDSYYGSQKGCGSSFPGAIREEGEDDFGAYEQPEL